MKHCPPHFRRRRRSGPHRRRHGPAAAAEQSARASVTYDDLDLSSDAGRDELAKRYDKVARDMCGIEADGKLRGKQRYCYENTSKSLQMRVAAILKNHDEARAAKPRSAATDMGWASVRGRLFPSVS